MRRVRRKGGFARRTPGREVAELVDALRVEVVPARELRDGLGRAERVVADQTVVDRVGVVADKLVDLRDDVEQLEGLLRRQELVHLLLQAQPVDADAVDERVRDRGGAGELRVSVPAGGRPSAGWSAAT